MHVEGDRVGDHQLAGHPAVQVDQAALARDHAAGRLDERGQDAVGPGHRDVLAVGVQGRCWCAARAETGRRRLKSWVSARLPISNRPIVEPASTMPGQMSSPLSSIVWASGGIGVPAGPIAAILPSAMTSVPPLISGPADRVQVGADQREEVLGLRGDFDRAVAHRFGAPPASPCGRPAGRPSRRRARAAGKDLAVDQRQLAAREGVERDGR